MDLLTLTSRLHKLPWAIGFIYIYICLLSLLEQDTLKKGQVLENVINYTQNPLHAFITPSWIKENA